MAYAAFLDYVRNGVGKCCVSETQRVVCLDGPILYLTQDRNGLRTSSISEDMKNSQDMKTVRKRLIFSHRRNETEKTSSEKWTGDGKYYQFVKRVFDIVASLIALVVLLPLFLVVSVLIFLDDPKGSPFFVQARVGKDFREFKFYKFRSMVVNAEELLDDLLVENEVEGCIFKIKDDPRITRVGRFIRRTSIDELPQLLNVLKGDMSIVGPRPPLPREVAGYTDYQKQRLSVTPGLTCYWQTVHHRNDLDFDERVALDLKYIKDRSPWLDLKLIALTFKVIFTGQGW